MRDILQECQRIQEERWRQVVEPVLLHYPEDRTPFSFSITLPLGDCILSQAVALECQIKNEEGLVRSTKIKGTTGVLQDEIELHGTRYVRLQVTSSWASCFWGITSLSLRVN